MPELDGYQTARLIKSQERTRHVPLLFLTAHPARRAAGAAGLRRRARWTTCSSPWIRTCCAPRWPSSWTCTSAGAAAPARGAAAGAGAGAAGAPERGARARPAGVDAPGGVGLAHGCVARPGATPPGPPAGRAGRRAPRAEPRSWRPSTPRSVRRCAPAWREALRTGRAWEAQHRMGRADALALAPPARDAAGRPGEQARGLPLHGGGHRRRAPQPAGVPASVSRQRDAVVLAGLPRHVGAPGAAGGAALRGLVRGGRAGPPAARGAGCAAWRWRTWSRQGRAGAGAAPALPAREESFGGGARARLGGAGADAGGAGRDAAAHRAGTRSTWRCCARWGSSPASTCRCARGSATSASSPSPSPASATGMTAGTGAGRGAGPPGRGGHGQRALVPRGPARPGQAQEANRLKDEFLATLSHELRTPLTSILGWTQMLLKRDDLDEASRRRGLATIERNARVQRQLVEDLLDVSRITSGKLLLNLKEVPLREVVEAALESVRPTAEARACSCSAELGPARARRAGGRHAAAAGAVEPAHQRHQVHRARAGACGSRRAGEEGPGEADGARHGQGHPARAAAPRLRALPPGGASAGSRGAWGWGWPSCGTWWSCTGARWACTAKGPARAPPSPFTCRCARCGRSACPTRSPSRRPGSPRRPRRARPWSPEELVTAVATLLGQAASQG